tara:strand:+ start:122 stop:766 length:645 start_codon:yes stop_codon:yes gene_type:complete
MEAQTETNISNSLTNLEKIHKDALMKKRQDLISMEDKVLKVVFNLQDFAENRVDKFTLNEGEYNELSKELATQYQELKRVLLYQQDTIASLFRIIGGIRDTDWYKKHTDQPYGQRIVLTQEEKLKDDNYQACRYCDSWIKKGFSKNGVAYMVSHQKRDKCKDIQLGREQSVSTRRPRNHSSAIVIGRQLEGQQQRRMALLEGLEEEADALLTPL